MRSVQRRQRGFVSNQTAASDGDGRREAVRVGAVAGRVVGGVAWSSLWEVDAFFFDHSCDLGVGNALVVVSVDRGHGSRFGDEVSEFEGSSEEGGERKAKPSL